MNKEEAICHLEEQYARIKRDWPGLELRHIMVHAAEEDLDDLVAFMKVRGVVQVEKKKKPHQYDCIEKDYGRTNQRFPL